MKIEDFTNEVRKYDSRLADAVSKKDGLGVREVVGKIRGLISTTYISNQVAIRNYLKSHIDDSLLTGAMHTAYFMEKGMPITHNRIVGNYRVRDDVSSKLKYFGLGMVSDSKERLERINYDVPHQYNFAMINGKDIQARKDLIKETQGLITKLYNSGEGEKIRNQIKLIDNLFKNPNISFSPYEMKETLLNLSDPLSVGVFSTIYLNSMPNHNWKAITELEFGGLGFEFLVKNGFGKGLIFRKNQMHFSKTNFYNAIKNENSFKGAEFVGNSPKKSPQLYQGIDFESPFLKILSRFEKNNLSRGKKPSLDDYDNRRDWDCQYELKYGKFYTDDD